MFSFRIIAVAVLGLASAACSSSQPMSTALTAASVEPKRPVLVRGDIIDAPAAEIDALLGVPALKRVEGAGEFRRYGFSECSVIILLYPDERGDIRARHVEATALSSGETKPDLDACLAAG